MQRDFFPTVHPTTICRALRDVGLQAYIRNKVPFINACNKNVRFEWAKEHARWTLVRWRKAIFSDKSKFNLFSLNGKQYVWRKPGEALDPRYMSKKVKHGGGSEMLWGCITPDGVGRIFRIEGRLTGARYKEILEKELLGSLANHKVSPKKIIFQHDNDPKHTSQVVKNWFKSKSIPVLP